MKNKKDLEAVANFLEKISYTTPSGEVLRGEEGALKFISLFFPEENEHPDG
jgi:hypothetical protein